MSWKKVSPKARGNKNLFDEWEVADIDRDEQEAGLARRAKRWKEMEFGRKNKQNLEKIAIDNADKMVTKESLFKNPSPLKMAWLRCDFILSNIMEKQAYDFMEWQRVNDPTAYKVLYRKFVSPNMMMNAQAYVDYFAQGGKAPKTISYPEIVKAYRNYYGLTRITVKHKDEEEYEL